MMCDSANEWFLPNYAVEVTRDLLDLVNTKYDNIENMIRELDLNMLSNSIIDGHLCFGDAESFATFKLKYG
jgi:hypothetical protein